MKVQWQGEVRWDKERWQRTGTFPEEPDNNTLRSKAWNVIGMRTKGSPEPVEVRKVKITYEAYSPIPFREERP